VECVWGRAFAGAAWHSSVLALGSYVMGRISEQLHNYNNMHGFYFFSLYSIPTAVLETL
jgi:hypothetical protein